MIASALIENIWKEGMRPDKIRETTKEVFNDIYRGQFEEIKELDEDLLSSLHRSTRKSHINDKTNEKEEKQKERKNNDQVRKRKKTKKKSMSPMKKRVIKAKTDLRFDIKDFENLKLLRPGSGFVREDREKANRSLVVETGNTRNFPFQIKTRSKEIHRKHSPVKTKPGSSALRRIKTSVRSVGKGLMISKSVDSVKKARFKHKSAKLIKGRSFHLNKLFKRALNSSNNIDIGSKGKVNFKKKEGSGRNVANGLKKIKGMVSSIQGAGMFRKKKRMCSGNSLERPSKDKSWKKSVKEDKSTERILYRVKRLETK